MRILVLVIVVLASAVSNSFGNVSFKWNSAVVGQAQYWNNYPTLPATYANTPGGWTVLTYISGDNVVDFDTGSTFTTSYGSGAGQDTYISALSAPLAGKYTTATITVGAAGNGAGSYVNSYAYFVLVAMPLTTFTGTYSSDITQIPVGTLYRPSAISAKLVQNDTEPLTPTQNFDVGTVRADIALVPEPSTFALLGIGLGLVGLRRFRRQ